MRTPGCCLTGLTRHVLQTALEVETPDHLGYDKDNLVSRNGQNSRNGSTPKVVRTEIGEVNLQIPRRREGTFELAIAPKYRVSERRMVDATPKSRKPRDASGRTLPLRAPDAGVIARSGDTQSAVDLMVLADLPGVMCISEIVRHEGEMVRLPELLQLGATEGVMVTSIELVFEDRLRL
jgi:hypothetical protein